MTAILALLLRIFSNPFSNVFQKKLCTYGFNPLLISFITYLLLSLGCLCAALHINWAQFDSIIWLYAFLGGIAGAFGNRFLLIALKYGELSVLGPINAYKSLISIVFAIFLLHEIPSLFQAAGIVFIIFGSYIIFDCEKEKFNLRIFVRRDIRYRIFALILCALEAVFIKKIILLSSVSASFIIWCTFSALFSYILLLFYKTNFKKQLSRVNFKTARMFFALALCVFLMQYSTNIVFKNMNVSCALALFQLSSLISVILGCRYFCEKNILKKISGTVVMILGSCAIILF